MITRRTLICGVAALGMAAAQPAGATSEKFTWAAFEAAQKAGKPILIEIFAGWCPICQVQRPIVEDLFMSERFKDLVYLEIDFDRQKDEMRKLGAQKQSTLIVFRGLTEVGRSVGDTKREVIEALMAKSL